MNIEKYTKEACGHLFAHYERAKDKTGKFVRFGNRDIDLTRTQQNYNLAPDHGGMTQTEYLQHRLSEVYHIKKKDLNVMCSWVITLPDDFPPDRQQEFFQSAYDFMAPRYGEDNIVSAYVHLDENLAKGHAHMHFAFIPVIYDKKKSRFKVSAKEVINRNELKCIHKEIEVYLTNTLGVPVHMLNGKTAEGNRSIRELKECQDKITAAHENIRLLSDKADRLHSFVEKQENELKEIRSNKERLMPIYAEGVEIPEVKEKHNIFGQARVELSAEAWTQYTATLLDISGTLEVACDKVRDAENEITMLRKKEKAFHDQELKAQELQKECISLKEQLIELQERLRRFLRLIFEVLPEFQETIKKCMKAAINEPEKNQSREQVR